MRAAAFVVLILAAGLAQAQTLNDPMRPPSALADGPVSKGGPVLQTVFIGPDRRYAIIDGQHVTQGSVVDGAKVVRIATNEVTLRDDAGETVLKLYPEVSKLIVNRQPAAAGAGPVERGRKQ
jgi:MSHA biogenesis protein MshK